MSMRFRWSFPFLILAMAITNVQPVAATTCTGSDHVLSFTVFSEGSVVSGAIVRFYLDQQHGRLADDVRQPWTEDATITTGSGGTGLIALAQGTYYVTITASGQHAYETSVMMPVEGSCAANTFSITPVATVGDFSYDKTTVTLSPTTINANGSDKATLTIQAFNQYGSIVPNIPVGLNTTFGGMQITRIATSTDIIGKASFIIVGTVPGVATLSPTLNNLVVKPQILTLVTPSQGSSTSTSSVSATRSGIVVNGTPALADGISTVRVDVYARDDQGHALSNFSVALRVGISGVSITPPIGTTDATGVAHFTMTNIQTATGYLTATVDGVALSDRPLIVFAHAQATPTPSPTTAPPSSGSLIKLPDDGNAKTQVDTTVYYLGSDGMRHPFPSQRVFTTWYPDFSSVHVVNADVMTNLPLGSPVTYRPGMRLVKSPSSPKVYAVASPNILRWITSGDLAAASYGANWNMRVDDLPDAFWTEYTVGSDVTSAAPFDATRETSNALSPDSTD